MRLPPCKGCGKRVPGCHDHCKAFLKWKEEKSAETRDIIEKTALPPISEHSKRASWKNQRYGARHRTNGRK